MIAESTQEARRKGQQRKGTDETIHSGVPLWAMPTCCFFSDAPHQILLLSGCSGFFYYLIFVFTGHEDPVVIWEVRPPP